MIITWGTVFEHVWFLGVVCGEGGTLEVEFWWLFQCIFILEGGFVMILVGFAEMVGFEWFRFAVVSG